MNLFHTQSQLTTGDKVNFKYTSGHNVAMVTKTAYDACNGNPLAVDGPYTWTAYAVEGGKHYFICGVPGHCKDGNMKITVTVSDNC